MVLYWITRMWLRAGRGELHDDPLVVTLTDPQTLILGVLGAVTIGMAL